MSYEFSRGLVAQGGIELSEAGKVRLQGALSFPKPVQLFGAFANDLELLRADATIPIPGVSIGRVGLVFKVSGRLGAGYTVGPGTLEDAKVEGAVSPLEDDPDLDVEIAARLVIPARAVVYGSLRGAVGVDALLASLSGGLTVTATATLDGGLQASLAVRFQKGQLMIKAEPELSAGLVLGLNLDADVTAELVGQMVRRGWHLAGYQYDSGLRFGVKAPISYTSGQPFKPPSLGDLQWTRPALRAPDLVTRVFRSALGPRRG